MNRIGLWLAVMLLLLSTLIGCGAKTPAVEVLNLTEMPLTDAQAVKLQEQMLETAASYRDLLPASVQTANYALSREQTAQIVVRLGESGFSVIDGDGTVDMQNPEAALLFGQAAQLGQDTSAALYRVYRDGGFTWTELTCQDGRITATDIRVIWDAELEPQISSISRRDVLELRCTEKGYLLWRTRELESVKNSPDYVPWQMVRLTPLDGHCRELCQRYIRPVGYANSNLFLTDWTVDAPGELVWNDVFPACYFLQTGILLTSHTCGGYSFDVRAGLLVPEADYIRYITAYFPVEPAALTAASAKEPVSGCYPVRLFTSGDMAHRLPTPEVTAWEENEDGSLTLTVEALDLENGTDCAFRHQVTVLPQTDRTWKYLGNYMLLPPGTAEK